MRDQKKNTKMPLFFNHYYKKKWFRIKGHSQLFEHRCVYLVKLSFVAKVALTLTCVFFFFLGHPAPPHPTSSSDSQSDRFAHCLALHAVFFFSFFPPSPTFPCLPNNQPCPLSHARINSVKEKCLAYQFSVQYFPYWRHCPRNNALDG